MQPEALAESYLPEELNARKKPENLHRSSCIHPAISLSSIATDLLLAECAGIGLAVVFLVFGFVVKNPADDLNDEDSAAQ